MAFNLQTGFGAGAATDMIQQILKQKAEEYAQSENRRIAEESRKQQAAERERSFNEGVRQFGVSETRMGDVAHQAQLDRDEARRIREEDLARNDARERLKELKGGRVLTPDIADPLRKIAPERFREEMASPPRPDADFVGPMEPKATGNYVVEESRTESERNENAPVVRLNPKTGQMEVMGYAPKGTHFATVPGEGQERAPYFTHQPIFDPEGRPIGAIRFDARGGPPTFVDVSGITGGQLKPPPAVLATQAILNEVGGDQLKRLRAMYDAGAKEFIGPAMGRAMSAGQQIPGVPVSKTFANFKAATDTFKNAVIKATTGAAMSVQEADRIMSQIPLETDKPDVWEAKADQTEQNLRDLANRLQTRRGGVGVGGGGKGGGPGTGGGGGAGTVPPKKSRFEIIDVK